jgi:hypothetical protein
MVSMCSLPTPPLPLRSCGGIVWSQGSDGVMKKLASKTYRLRGEPLEDVHVRTAAEAQVERDEHTPHLPWAGRDIRATLP